MANYKVAADVMEVIDDAAGYYQSGQPKKILEWHKGDDVDVSMIPDDRLQVLVDQGVIVEDKGENKPADKPAPD
jgi:hypothetical protein